MDLFRMKKKKKDAQGLKHEGEKINREGSCTKNEMSSVLYISIAQDKTLGDRRKKKKKRP